LQTALAAGWLLLGYVASLALAHEGPQHVIDELTTLMGRTGPNAVMLYCRAKEYRALGQDVLARNDLIAALNLDEKLAVAHLELGRLLLKLKEYPAALGEAERLQEVARDAAQKAEALALQGEIRLAQHDWKSAEDAYTRALSARRDVTWYLLRSRAQAHIPAVERQIEGLKTGHKLTHSPVLLRALCDALIERGGPQLSEAQTIVDSELAASRLRGSWLLRRAQIALKQGAREKAEEDLQAALVEFEERLDPKTPDVGLLVERGLAHALRGDTTQARADLTAATERGTPEWLLAPLKAAVK